MRTVEPGETFVTPDALAARALKEAQRKRNPEAAETPYDPEGAVIAAEIQRRILARQDTLLALRDRRKITAPELRAAHEIAAVVAWAEDINPPVARSQFRERLAGSTSADPGTRWLWLLEAEHTRYAPWREWARCQRVGVKIFSLEALTRLFAVEDWGTRRVEKAAGLRNGRALLHLRRSLHHYARTPGWQTGDEPPVIDT